MISVSSSLASQGLPPDEYFSTCLTLSNEILMLIVKYRLKNFVGSKSQAHSYILLWAGPNQSSPVKTDFFFLPTLIPSLQFPSSTTLPTASFQ